MLATATEKILSFPLAAPESKPIIGCDGGLRQVWEAVKVVAPTDAAVLIQGETGTGKELIARAIHERSQRRNKPYLKINCAAIPAALLESELFGHERGAFTGALTRTTGRFELADGGTLFLDEVGDLPLELQPKLLRVLQEQEFERLGSARTIRVNVRVVAATNSNLIEMVRERKFRADLFFRLNVFPIPLPPLRERLEDIPDLVGHFVQRFAARLNKSIDEVPASVMEALRLYDWPGNIRELENLIERAVILSKDPVLRPPLCELPGIAKGRETAIARTRAEVERHHIVEALRLTRGRISGQNGAATRLGMKRSTLLYRMQKLGIEQKRVYAAALA